MRYARSVTLLTALLLCARSAAALDDAAADAVFFRQQIEPILVGHCLDCHGAAKKGGLDLRTKAGALAGGDSGRVIEPGQADESLLYQYVAGHEMPPKQPLSAQQISALEKWIRDGAFYPPEPLDPFAITTERRAGFNWWSLQPLKQITAPTSLGIAEAWQANAIDRFVYAKLAQHKLHPSPPADPTTLIRRAAYDLIGLPPTPTEVDAFLVACRDEVGKAGVVGQQAYTNLIDALLASPRYGEQWGRHWLDVVRFGESNGFERNVIHTNLWPFRDYVIQSLNNDKPFDTMVLEHLAGDVVAPDDPAVAIGAAFLVCGPYDNVGNQDAAAAAQIRANTIDEMIRATSEAFLGMTVGCSRCHDHKFDPIAQQDYYRLYATFAGVKHNKQSIGSELKLADGQTAPKPWHGHFQQADGPFHVFVGGSPQRPGAQVMPASMRSLDHATRGYRLASTSPEHLRRSALAQWVVAADNPLTPRVLANRLWHYHFGTGIVNTPNDFGFLGGRPSHPELLDWLALQLRNNDWRLKPIHRRIMLSQTYRQSSQYRATAAQQDGDSRLLWRFPPRRLTSEEIRDSMLAVANKLDLQMGGPGFRLFRYVQDNVATYHPLAEHGPETFRRAVYHHQARAMQIDLMTEFDTPDCAFSAPRRTSTTTPLQALTMLNHSFTLAMAEALAERIKQDADDDSQRAIDQAFRLAYSRPPRDEEATAAQKLVDTHGMRAFCRALLNSSEFIHLD